MITPETNTDHLMENTNNFLPELEEANKKLEEEKIKNEYLSAQINIHTNSHNIGEKDEVLSILKLFYYNKSNQYDKLIEIFGDEACEGISIIDETGCVITDINKINKAKGCLKADVIIKMNKTTKIYTASIKSKNGANPTILNHTPRSAKIFITGCLNKCIPSIDILMQEYIDKRTQKIIGEDIQLNTLECMKDSSIISDVTELLSYFVFDGTGKGDSSCKANSILYYEKNNISFIKCCEVEEKMKYIESIINSCIISLRDKGMPKTITDNCNPWVFKDCQENDNIKYKGSLHIRLK
jgi:hypothetical protein